MVESRNVRSLHVLLLKLLQLGHLIVVGTAHFVHVQMGSIEERVWVSVRGLLLTEILHQVLLGTLMLESCHLLLLLNLVVHGLAVFSLSLLLVESQNFWVIHLLILLLSLGSHLKLRLSNLQVVSSL